MKTYLLDTIERYKRFSQSLDVKTILCSKAWYVLNEDGDTEILIFQEDGTILVSVNGSTKKYTWHFIPQNQSLNIMHSESEGTMLKPAFMDGKILAFNKIGTKECMFLIDESWDVNKRINSLQAVKNHLDSQRKNVLEDKKKSNVLQLVESVSEVKSRNDERTKILEKLSNLKDKYKSKVDECNSLESTIEMHWYNIFEEYEKRGVLKEYHERERFFYIFMYILMILIDLSLVGTYIYLIVTYFDLIFTFEITFEGIFYLISMIMLTIILPIYFLYCLCIMEEGGLIGLLFGAIFERRMYRKFYKKIYLKHKAETGEIYEGFCYDSYDKIQSVGRQVWSIKYNDLRLLREDIAKYELQLHKLSK